MRQRATSRGLPLTRRKWSCRNTWSTGIRTCGWSSAKGNRFRFNHRGAECKTWFDPPIREAAIVYINDKQAGSLWCPPYSVDVTKLLKPGGNKIRIVVANTALNYMAGHSLPDYRLLTLRYGERFQAQDMDKVQALPSGLLGPIRLIATTK